MENVDIAQIRSRSVQSIVALISRTSIINILSLATSLFIFSVLSAHDVGVYTAVVAMQRVISFFTDFGFGAALVQKKESLYQEELTTSFSVQLLVTLGIFILAFLSNSTLASFFNLSDAGQRLFLALVFTLFISSFKIIPSILLERDITFHKLIIPQLVEAVVYNGLLVILLLRGFGLDSFTFSFLLSSIAGVPFYYLVRPWKMQFGIDRKSLTHLRYGVAFQGKNVLATIKDDFLTVFLVKLLSFVDLGYIGFAQRISFFVFRYIVDSVTKVTFSTYARIQHDTQVLRKTIEKSLFFISLTMFPMLCGLIVVIPYVVAFFPKWHNKWEPAIFSVIFFALNAMLSSLSNILVTVLDATGHVKTTLRLMVLWTIITWVLTPFLIYFYGYNGVAVASFMVTLTIFYTISLVKKIVVFDFFRSIYKPFIASVAMSVSVYFVSRAFIIDLSTLVLVIAFGALVYGALIYLLVGKEVYADIAKIVKKR